ncbi:MAG: phytoene desaturase family protein [Candidatus Woesearchaeota archaeon]
MAIKAIIIGAGYGGLSCAALLAKEGYDVHVIDKIEQAGGKGSLLQEEGFSFDMGPSWYLMPDVFEKFFSEFGKKPEDYYTIKRLDPSYRIYFGKDDKIDISPRIEDNAELFDKLEENGRKKFLDYLAQSEYQYNVAMKDFVYKRYTKITDFFNKRMATEGMKLKVLKNFDKHVSTYFKSDKAKKILEYNIVFLGGTPYNTPALYSIMTHVDFNLGVWYPIGGLNAVAKGIEKLALEHNAKFTYNHTAEKIIVENGRAVGVMTNKGRIDADIVVVNADMPHAEISLLDKKYQSYNEKYWEKKTIAPSGFIMYLGVKRKVKGLEHHNLFLDNDWMKHFDQIFKKPGWPDNPSYYVCAPTITEPETAPNGMENLFILVPVAADLEDNNDIREEYASDIIRHLGSIIGDDFSKDIVYKKIFAHNDFIQRYNAYKGTALGLSHTLMQSALFRPDVKSKKVKSLYYTGQYVHPGIGVPMVIIASDILRGVILNEHPL